MEVIHILIKDCRIEINICFFGYLEIIRLLIKDPRVDINTPFYYVCCNKHIEIINLFLSSNKNINYGYYSGTTYLDILKNQNINLNEIKKIKISKNEKLLFSSADNDLKTLKELLKYRNNKRSKYF